MYTSLSKKLPNCFLQNGYTSLHSYQKSVKVPVGLNAHQHLILSGLFACLFFSHSSKYVVISRYGFNLHPCDEWYWISFHVVICYPHKLFWWSIKIFCQLSVCFLIEFWELFIYPRCKSFIRCYFQYFTNLVAWLFILSSDLLGEKDFHFS